MRNKTSRVTAWLRMQAAYLPPVGWALLALAVVMAAVVTVSMVVTNAREPDTGAQRMMPVLDAADVPRGMNPDLAAGAGYRQHPYVYAAKGTNCRIWMRLPDGVVWSMPPLTQVNLIGTTMTPQPRETFAEANRSTQCDQQGPTPNSGVADPAAVAAAKAAGIPYVATSADWTDGCHAFITLPDGTRWGVDDTAVGGPFGELTGNGVRANSCD